MTTLFANHPLLKNLLNATPALATAAASAVAAGISGDTVKSLIISFLEEGPELATFAQELLTIMQPPATTTAVGGANSTQATTAAKK